MDAGSVDRNLSPNGQLNATVLDTVSQTIPVIVHASDHHAGVDRTGTYNLGATAKRVQFWFALILRLVAAGLLLIAGLKAKAAIATGLGGGEAGGEYDD